mmetsp:Transcript_133011/g.331902  ORF Transcript_133011/g.331902 Transcript_133011/m.331902 type:complete len:211 (-) Transcript_133011:682-1314(-)
MSNVARTVCALTVTRPCGNTPCHELYLGRVLHIGSEKPPQATTPTWSCKSRRGRSRQANLPVSTHGVMRPSPACLATFGGVTCSSQWPVSMPASASTVQDKRLFNGVLDDCAAVAPTAAPRCVPPTALLAMSLSAVAGGAEKVSNEGVRSLAASAAASATSTSPEGKIDTRTTSLKMWARPPRCSDWTSERTTNSETTRLHTQASRGRSS